MTAGENRETPVRGADPIEMGRVTTAIIAANVAIFVWEVLASKSADALVSVPGFVTRVFGANYAPLTLTLHQYDRLLASCFVHGSALHVGLNMWSLRQIGPFVERTVGAARYSILYVVSGILASAASIGWGLARSNPVPSVGASGAICGVLGAAFILGVRLEGWNSGIARQIGFWLIMILGYGAAVANVDNAAHVGGLVAGAVIATMWKRGVGYSRAATAVCVGLSAALCLASGVAMAYRDATDPFAQYAPNERSNQVVFELHRGNCPGARLALQATEAVAAEVPELRGLRAQVDRACGPATP